MVSLDILTDVYQPFFMSTTCSSNFKVNFRPKKLIKQLSLGKMFKIRQYSCSTFCTKTAISSGCGQLSHSKLIQNTT